MQTITKIGQLKKKCYCCAVFIIIIILYYCWLTILLVQSKCTAILFLHVSNIYICVWIWCGIVWSIKVKSNFAYLYSTNPRSELLQLLATMQRLSQITCMCNSSRMWDTSSPSVSLLIIIHDTLQHICFVCRNYFSITASGKWWCAIQVWWIAVVFHDVSCIAFRKNCET